MTIVYCILCLIIGGSCATLYFYPRCKAFQRIDEKTKEENELQLAKLKKIQDDIGKLLFEQTEIEKDTETLVRVKKDLQNQNNTSMKQLQELKKIVTDLRENAENEAKAYYTQKMSQIKNQIEVDTQQEKEQYQKTIEDLIIKCSQLKEEQDALQATVNSAVEVAKRAEEEKEKENFYKLRITEEDLREIQKLREVAVILRDQEPLNKVIWKVYYEKPTTDMIGRIVGNKKCGIYKITNLLNNKCYVGQTNNFSERFKQHIKRGIGADAPTKNKLYPAMLKEGIENFSFEIIQCCEAHELNEREQFWQNFYKAREFGYSIK